LWLDIWALFQGCAAGLWRRVNEPSASSVPSATPRLCAGQRLRRRFWKFIDLEGEQVLAGATLWLRASSDKAIKRRDFIVPLARRQRYDVAMRLVRASSFERTREAVVAAIETYRTGSGGYQLNNTFRYLVTRG
jgi:hypothetical protein